MTPPGAPGAPTAVAGNAQATVTITAPSTGGTPASYTVTAVDSTDSGHGGQTCTVTSPATSCTLTGLTNGDSYTFTSTATNVGGTSGASPASNAVVPEAPPGAPGAPTAVAGNAQATVTITAPTTGGPPTSYTVTAIDSTNPEDGGQTCTVTSPATSCTLTGLTNGDSYTFTSTATNVGGTSGASPASNAVVPEAPPGAPGAPTAVAGNAEATVTITAPSTGGTPASYTVTAVDSTDPANGGQTCTVTSPATSCTVTGLTNGDSYTFTATATNVGGTSGASDPSNAVVPMTPPGAPGAPTAVAGNAQATVTITAPSTGGTPASYTVTAVDSTDPANGGQTCTVTSPATSCTLTGLTNGDSYTFIATATNVGGTSEASPASNAVVPKGSSGYWLVGGDGGVFSFGTHFYGSTGNLKLNQPVFAITSTRDGKGYWFVARDGGVFSYGDAEFHGSVPALGEHVTNIVGMAADPATDGYWLVGADGGVYAFDAPFLGSLPGLHQSVGDIVGMAAMPDGGGYYLVGANGSVYPFGDAKSYGEASTMSHLNAPIVGITVDSATGGYWEAGSDGGVYAYGAPFHGSAGGTRLNRPVVGIAATSTGSGYYLVASDGGVFSYNAPFLGSMAGTNLNEPVVGITTAGTGAAPQAPH
jgi:hypothetical protein